MLAESEMEEISVTPKAVLFDWDNTLVDTWPIIVHALNLTFVAMGREAWPAEDIRAGREGIHESLRNSFPRLFGERWEAARDVYLGHFLECHLAKIAPIVGALDVLNALHKAGVPMALVSNKTGKHLRTEVEFLGWGHYFRAVIGATDTAEDKPSAIPMRLALEAMGVEASADVWMVGDSHTDVQAALNAGCKPVLFGDTTTIEAWTGERHLIDGMPHYAGHACLYEAVMGDFGS